MLPTLMITGGTGSLGQELVKQLVNSDKYNKIIIYSRCEQKQEEMQRKFNSPKLRFYIGDVRDVTRLKFAMKDASVVIHAAALKIVPAGENDPIEFVKTNIDGTVNVIQACLDNKVQKMMLISTDKAVYPINLYGATKLCAEKLTIAANNYSGEYGPRFAVCRYGNVTGSRGSVIPLFAAQKKAKQKITITDPNMTRFWITLSDAAKFVLTSVDTMYANKKLYIPHMKSYVVGTLASVFSKTNTIIGVRPSEKFDECIYTDDERQIFNLISPQYSNLAHNMSCKVLRSELKKEGFLK